MPHIYVRLFLNDLHDAPTPQQMYDFSQWAIVYSKPCHGWTAQQLDDVYLAEKQSNGKLAKEDVQHGNCQIIPGDHRNKLDKVKIWATAIEQRMLALPSVDLDKSLPSPPTDTSYAKSAAGDAAESLPNSRRYLYLYHSAYALVWCPLSRRRLRLCNLPRRAVSGSYASKYRRGSLQG